MGLNIRVGKAERGRQERRGKTNSNQQSTNSDRTLILSLRAAFGSALRDRLTAKCES